MNEEEKAMYNVVDNINIYNHQDTTIGVDGTYEELDDDFILALNGGVPALELIDKDQLPVNNDESINDNIGVIHVDDIKPTESGDNNEPGITNYKEKYADVIAMLEKQEEFKK